MLAASYQYPILDFFLTMLYFFLFIIWIWLLIMVFIDIFRSHDMGGVGQGAVGDLRHHPALPGCLRVPDRPGRQDARAGGAAGGGAAEAFDAYVKQAAGTAGDTTADQLSKLADLKSQGVITDAEFDAQKSKILAS